MKYLSSKSDVDNAVKALNELLNQNKESMASSKDKWAAANDLISGGRNVTIDPNKKEDNIIQPMAVVWFSKEPSDINNNPLYQKLNLMGVIVSHNRYVGHMKGDKPYVLSVEDPRILKDIPGLCKLSISQLQEKKKSAEKFSQLRQEGVSSSATISLDKNKFLHDLKEELSDIKWNTKVKLLFGRRGVPEEIAAMRNVLASLSNKSDAPEIDNMFKKIKSIMGKVSGDKNSDPEVAMLFQNIKNQIDLVSDRPTVVSQPSDIYNPP